MSPGRQSKAAPVAPGGFLPVGLAAVTAYEGCARRRIDDTRRDQRRWIDAPLPATAGQMARGWLDIGLMRSRTPGENLRTWRANARRGDGHEGERPRHGIQDSSDRS